MMKGLVSIHNVLELSEKRYAAVVRRGDFDVRDGKIKCAVRCTADTVLVANTEVGYGDVDVVDDCLEHFHEVASFFFFFLLGGPLGRGGREAAELRAAGDD